MFASLHTSSLAVGFMQARTTSYSLARRVRLALFAHQQRAHLARLDGHLLADIGLSADQAATEAARPLWDVPANWLR